MAMASGAIEGIAFDKTHSAVNQRDAIFAEIFSHLIEEALQRRSWYVNLRDHLRRRKRSVDLVVDFAVVIVWIDTQLVNIRQVHISIS